MTILVLALASFFAFADPPSPVLTYLSPGTAVSGSAGFQIAASGMNFVSKSVVTWNGKQLPTTYISDTQLTAQVGAEDIAAAGSVQVAVVNALASQQQSNVIMFTVQAAAPQITGVTPSAGLIAGGTRVTISGANFAPGATVRFAALTAGSVQYITSGSLSVAVPAASSPGTVAVSVTNADGKSATLQGAFSYQFPFAVVSSGLPAGATGTSYSYSLQASGGTAPYTWKIKSGALAPGLSLSSSGVVSGTPTQAGAFNVELEAAESSPLAQSASRSFVQTITAPFQISDITLSAAQLNVPYSASMSATGGTAPFNWAITSGSLPPGLMLGASTGQISGTPYVQGTYSFTLRAMDSSTPARSDSRSFTLKVGTAPDPLHISTTTLSGGTVGTAYSATLAATGGTAPLTWRQSTGSLPPGLTLAASSGTISGTPSSAGSYTFSITAADAAGTPQTATASYIVTIAAAATAPSPAANDTIVFQDDFESGTLSKWDAVDPRFAVESISGRVASGKYSLRGTITPTSGYGELNKWYMPGYDELYLKFKVMFEEGFLDNGSSDLLALMGNRIDNKWSASGQAGVKPSGTDFFLSILNPEPPSLNGGTQGLYPFMLLSQYPGMTCATPCSPEPFYQQMPRVETSAGQWHEVVFRLKANTPGSADGAQTLWIDGKKQIDIEGLRWRDTTDVRLNQLAIPLYMPGASQTEHVWFDDVVVWAPAATTQDPASSQPNPSQTQTSQAGTSTGTSGGSSMLAVTTASVSPGTVGASYSGTLAASGGTGSYRWSVSVGNLPPGLTLSSNGSIAGTPTAAGTYSFTALVSDSLSLAVRSLSLTVLAEPLSMATSSLPSGLQQVAYGATLSAHGGGAPYTWSVAGGFLPAGLTLDGASGTITGTPAAQGSYSVDVQVKDTFGSTVKRTFAIVVAALSAVSISTTALPAATSGTDYSAALAATGGAAPYTWSLASGSLPPGLILGAVTGDISGDPSAEGTYDFTVRVADGASQTDSKAMEIAVAKGTASSGMPSPQAGDTIVFQDDFESGTLSKWDEAPSRYAIESNPADVYSGRYALRGTMNAGANYGELNKWYMPGYDELYVKFRVMFSAGFQDDGMHLLGLMGETMSIISRRPAARRASVPPEATSSLRAWIPSTRACTGGVYGLYPLQFYTYWPGMGCPSNYDPVNNQNCYGDVTVQNTPKIVNTPGVWHEVAVHVKLNSIGQSDGVQELWVDGQKAISQTGMQFRTTTDLRLNQFSWQLYAQQTPQVQYVWMDDLVAWSPAADSTSSTGGSLAITAASLPAAKVGVAYSTNVAVSGGSAPRSWSIASGSLPSGMSLDATTGQISGVATAVDTCDVTIKVSDANGQTVSKSFTLQVQSNPLAVATGSVPTGTVNTAYSTSLAASGGLAPYSWTLQSGSLPGGLSLNSATGAIVGTPSATGTYSFTAQVQDALGQSSSRSLSLNVNNVNVNDVPSGGTPVFSDNFESAPTYTSRGGKYLDVARVYWVSTASGGVAHSGTHSIVVYNGSAPGVLSCQGDCSAGAAPILRVPDFCCLTELWTRHWEYWATTTVATADKNGFPHHGPRVRHSWDGDREYEAMIDGSGNCWGDGTHYSMQLNPDPAGKAACAVSHYDVVANKGAWHCIESHMKLNSAGAANGVLEMYVDGSSTPSAATSSVNFGSNPLGIGSLSFVSNATGGDGSWPSSTNYRYIDDVAWGTSRIGCN